MLFLQPLCLKSVPSVVLIALCAAMANKNRDKRYFLRLQLFSEEAKNTPGKKLDEEDWLVLVEGFEHALGVRLLGKATEELLASICPLDVHKVVCRHVSVNANVVRQVAVSENGYNNI